MAYVGEGLNEHGTPISLFVCDACGDPFSLCPAVPEERRAEWNGCMAPLCPSYDIDRDVMSLIDRGATIEQEGGQ